MNTPLEEKRDLLCRAIKDKTLVQFTYDGRVRIVEPFICGISTAGNYVLSAFQLRGSGKTKPMSWRMFELGEMSQLTVTRHTFQGKRDKYNSEDPAITEKFCRI